jgi:hypothetical protein
MLMGKFGLLNTRETVGQLAAEHGTHVITQLRRSTDIGQSDLTTDHSIEAWRKKTAKIISGAAAPRGHLHLPNVYQGGTSSEYPAATEKSGP